MPTATRAQINRQIGMRLRQARELRQMTRTELATHLSTSPRQLARYEAGTAAITVEKLEQAAAALDWPLSLLFEPCPYCGAAEIGRDGRIVPSAAKRKQTLCKSKFDPLDSAAYGKQLRCVGPEQVGD